MSVPIPTDTPLTLTTPNHGPITLHSTNTNEPKIHATTNPSPTAHPARLTYTTSNQLQHTSPDGMTWILGRYLVEDRSLLPKKVFFLRDGESGGEAGEKAFGGGEVRFEKGSTDGGWVVRIAGASLLVIDGGLYAGLMGEPPTEFDVVTQS